MGSDASREKQKLVRTVALGNLTPAVRARAVAYAQAAGKVSILCCLADLFARRGCEDCRC